MAPLTADFGPFALLLKAQNTPLREHPIALPCRRYRFWARMSFYEKEGLSDKKDQVCHINEVNQQSL